MGGITEIRRAEPSEREALTALHKRSSWIWEEDRRHLEAHPEVFGVDPEALEDGGVRVGVDAGGHTLGFATISPRPDGACELVDLFVEPESMRQGVGAALTEDAAARAAQAGHQRMTVVAAERLLPFYERFGFSVSEQVQTRFAPALRLWRELAPGGG